MVHYIIIIFTIILEAKQQIDEQKTSSKNKQTDLPMRQTKIIHQPLKLLSRKHNIILIILSLYRNVYNEVYFC